jgi:hypothetical protein
MNEMADDRECLVSKDLKGYGYGLLADTVPAFSWQNWGKLSKKFS